MANNNTAGNPLAEVSAMLGGSNQTSTLNEQLATVAQQLQALQAINQSQLDAVKANTTAVAQNPAVKGESVGSTAGAIGSTLLDVLGLGSGLSPLITSLIGLFGGGGSSQPAPLTPYIQPLPVNLTAGIQSGSNQAVGVDYGQGGQPRPVSAAAATQVTVQVQAMDSKSFLDHSNDIAMAVRQAMLESSTLNDVIREL